MSLCNFDIFLKLEESLNGLHFCTRGCIVQRINCSFGKTVKNGTASGIQHLAEEQKQCIDIVRDYTEVLKKFGL